MKTNELEKLLGTTKDTLRYYEKEELISPSRDEISLNTCLNQKKEYLLKEIGKKQRIIDLIEKNLSRKKAF